MQIIISIRKLELYISNCISLRNKIISMKNKKDFVIKLNKDIHYFVFSLAVLEHIFY